MTQQTRISDVRLLQAHQNSRDMPVGGKPIFFFDGDFRTWAQVEQRALLNKAIAVHLSRRPLR